MDATNQVMSRLQHLLDNQKRFVRDTSHQLRTPLAVLKTQVQSALRGDVEPRQALLEISDTVERATVLANQMLSLAKVEQLRQQPDASVHDFAEVVRSVALELSPLDRRQGSRLRHRHDGRAGARRTTGCCANSRATCCTTPSSTARPVARCRCV